MLSFYLDEDSLGHPLVQGLVSRGVDVTTAASQERLHLSDDEQLLYAAEQRRVLFTSNVNDFPRLHYEWLGRGLHHAGIVVRTDQQAPIGPLIRGLIRLATELDADSMRDRLEFTGSWTREDADPR